mmetsp:Transcript_69886/g.198341  ORF Transcript_69886/g.198341 Transcript_69886/m.198341 type:complete len:492 (-) Transcript_69886:109-1584(-)
MAAARLPLPHPAGPRRAPAVYVGALRPGWCASAAARWRHSVDTDRDVARHNSAEEPAPELAVAHAEARVEEPVKVDVGRGTNQALRAAHVEAGHERVEVDEQGEQAAHRQRRQLGLQLGHLPIVAQADAAALVEKYGPHALDVVTAHLRVEDEAGAVRGPELALHDAVAVPVHAPAAQRRVEHHTDGRELHPGAAVAHPAPARPRRLCEDVAVGGDDAHRLGRLVPAALAELVRVVLILFELLVALRHLLERTVGHVFSQLVVAGHLVPARRRGGDLHGHAPQAGRGAGARRGLRRERALLQLVLQVLPLLPGMVALLVAQSLQLLLLVPQRHLLDAVGVRALHPEELLQLTGAPLQLLLLVHQLVLLLLVLAQLLLQLLVHLLVLLRLACLLRMLLALLLQLLLVPGASAHRVGGAEPRVREAAGALEPRGVAVGAVRNGQLRVGHLEPGRPVRRRERVARLVLLAVPVAAPRVLRRQERVHRRHGNTLR